jgi:hypothetical protein
MGKTALVLLAALAGVTSGCAARHRQTANGGAARKYPARPASCKLTLSWSPTPPVAAWDDLGVAEVGCHINTAEPECISQLRAEACRMGGDILYNLPRRPLRPRDELVVYRGQVAHSLERADKKPPEPEPEISKGPVEPLVPAAPAAADAGSGG